MIWDVLLGAGLMYVIAGLAVHHLVDVDDDDPMYWYERLFVILCWPLVFVPEKD